MAGIWLPDDVAMHMSMRKRLTCHYRLGGPRAHFGGHMQKSIDIQLIRDIHMCVRAMNQRVYCSPGGIPHSISEYIRFLQLNQASALL